MKATLRQLAALSIVTTCTALARGQEATPPSSSPAPAAQAPAAAMPSTAAPRARDHRRQRSPSQPWRKRKVRRPNESEPVEATAAAGNEKAHFILGVERATSVLHWTLRGTNAMQLSSQSSGTDIAFLGGGSASGGNIFAFPRIGFDALYGYVTAGGSLIYMRATSSIGDGDVLIISPRLGALFPKTGVVRAWLRGGASYASISSDVTGINDFGDRVNGELSANLFELTLEPMLVIMASKQVAITLGPSFDIGIAGSASLDVPGIDGLPAQSDLTASSYGIAAGLFAIF